MGPGTSQELGQYGSLCNTLEFGTSFRIGQLPNGEPMVKFQFPCQSSHVCIFLSINSEKNIFQISYAFLVFPVGFAPLGKFVFPEVRQL